MHEASGLPEIALRRRLTLGLAALGLMAIGGTLALWARLGTAVFLDTIAAGFAYCF